MPNIHGCKLFIVINLMEFTTKHHYGFCWLWNVGNYLWDIRVSIFCFKKCPLHLVVTSCPTLTCTRSKGERINVGSSWLPYFDILNVICALLKRWKIKRRLLLVVHSLPFSYIFAWKVKPPSLVGDVIYDVWWLNFHAVYPKLNFSPPCFKYSTHFALR